MKSIATVVQNHLTGWVLGLVLAATAGATSAAVLYEQAPDLAGDAYASYSGAGQMLAEDFTLGGGVDLDGIAWWGSFVADDDLDNFHVGLFSDLNSAPLADLSGVAITRSDVGNDVYKYQLATTQSLALGTYYLAVLNDNAEWYWQRALTGNGLFWVNSASGGGWESSAGEDPPTQADLALSLTGERQQQPLPEPGTLGLLLAAGAALLAARRRA